MWAGQSVWVPSNSKTARSPLTTAPRPMFPSYVPGALFDVCRGRPFVYVLAVRDVLAPSALRFPLSFPLVKSLQSWMCSGGRDVFVVPGDGCSGTNFGNTERASIRSLGKGQVCRVALRPESLLRRMSGVTFTIESVLPGCVVTRGPAGAGARARLEWRVLRSCSRVSIPRPWPSIGIGAHPSYGHDGNALPPAACMARRCRRSRRLVTSTGRAGGSALPRGVPPAFPRRKRHQECDTPAGT